ncbi:retrovirus-related pol polyprotein from transposon TNT 1-94 [Tanacetum coccineum]
MPVDKTNKFYCNSTRVAVSSSVRRSESKDTNSKKSVLLNTKSKRTSKDVKKSQTKTVNVVHDGSNIVCVSCGKDVFMISHDKCVARYALSLTSRVKRALFTSSVAAKSSKLGVTPIVTKSKFSVAIPPKATNRVPSASPITPESRQSLRHNLFSVGQFCYGDLEVAFHSNNCFIHNLEGEDLLTGSYESNLYTISIFEMAASSPVRLMFKATSTKSWLWHRRLSHLNFGTINQLTKHELVDELSRFKYDKDHLCSACEQGKSKKATFPSKLVPSKNSKLKLLHMDLCGPMRAETVNGKRYILVIVDDYSRSTWVFFLRTKDETPEIIMKFITQIQRNIKDQVLKIRSDNGTEFKNATLKSYYEKLGIVHHTSIAQTPQQNGVVEHRNRTLVEAARTMLIFSKLPEFLWAKAISTACFT